MGNVSIRDYMTGKVIRNPDSYGIGEINPFTGNYYITHPAEKIISNLDLPDDFTKDEMKELKEFIKERC